MCLSNLVKCDAVCILCQGFILNDEGALIQLSSQSLCFSLYNDCFLFCRCMYRNKSILATRKVTWDVASVGAFLFSLSQCRLCSRPCFCSCRHTASGKKVMLIVVCSFSSFPCGDSIPRASLFHSGLLAYFQCPCTLRQYSSSAWVKAWWWWMYQQLCNCCGSPRAASRCALPCGYAV